MNINWTKSALVLCLLLVASVSQAKSYKIYSYHTDAPFYLPNQSSDLSRAWVQSFNRLNSDTQLELIQIPRPKLNALVKSGKPYLILWANALWFKSKDKNIRTTDVMFWDADIWLSNKNDQVNYESPKDLIGLTIGGRTGYYYKGVNELVAQEKITRIDQSTDIKNAESLIAKKIKAFVMSRSSYLYWQTTDMDIQPFYTAISAHDAFTRHVLVSSDNQHLIALINKTIKTLKLDSDWQAKLIKWGVTDLVNPFDLELNELQGVDLDRSLMKLNN